MANMSYCKFRNTLEDIEDCMESLRDREETSREELDAAREIILEVLDFCRISGVIDSYDDMTLETSLNELLEEEEEEDEEDY